MRDIVEKAQAFAASAHQGQVRKYTGRPYITHPAAVVRILRRFTSSPEALAAAWLHDVVEDCGVGHGQIFAQFGRTVSEYVFWLTDVSRPIDGNREARKRLDRWHVVRAPGMAQTIKLADMIDNTRSIVKHDPKFARVYLKEKMLLLDVLLKSDRDLWHEAYDLVESSLATLGFEPPYSADKIG